MRCIQYLFNFSLIGLLSAGCLVTRINTSPGASGVVLDSHTHLPVPGAIAVVCRPYDTNISLPALLSDKRPPVVKTSNDGHFSIRPEWKWEENIIGDPMRLCWGTLVIEKEGYESTRIPLPPDLFIPGDEPLAAWHDGVGEARWRIDANSFKILLKPVR
jgi:hypothetical protein